MGDWRSSEINISAIKVAGFGGAGMVFVAMMLVFELEPADGCSPLASPEASS